MVTLSLGAGTAVAAGPVITGMPVLAGIAQEGQTLTLTPGTWSDMTAVTVADVWESCSGGTCSAINPQPGASYVLTPADVGSTVQVVETAVAADGTATTTSAPTTTVIALAPTNTAPPAIAGIAQEGQVLTLTHGQWTSNPTVTDQWERCAGSACTPISGQSAATYTVTVADAGHTLEVLETASNTGGTVSVSSTPTAVIVPPPTEISAPSVGGNAVQGSLLTEAHASWTGAPASFNYQWYRCGDSGCAPIPGAMFQTYRPSAADVGSALLVAEVATNAGGSSAPADSALTPVVTPPAPVTPVPVSISPPTISGVARQGQTLVEGHGSWSDNPSSYTYRWLSCDGAGCADIAGATEQSYTLTASDVGRLVAVMETATNGGGSGLAQISAPTAPVSTSGAASLGFLPNDPTTNQAVALVATVSSGSANARPTGSLTFVNAGRPIAGCANKPVAPTGQVVTVICQSSFAAGTSSLSAIYSPSAGALVAAATSSPVALDVGRDATSTALAVTKQVARGKRATYAATLVVAGSGSGPLQPTGSVEFLDGGRPIGGCLRRPLSGLAATCSVVYRSTGQHQISARYVGDPNFAGSSSDGRSVRIVEHASAPVVLGFVSSTLQWQFQYHRAYTLVTMLQAARIAKGMNVSLACSGPSCPFSRISLPGAATNSLLDLLPQFHRRHLRPGSHITVRIMRPQWIGKYYSFTVRAGRGPLIVLSCLGVGRARPGVDC
jgi:hypothetical protein